MKKTGYLLFFLLLAGHFLARGQDFSNKGKEFWIAYPAHVDGTTSVMGLYITASVNTSGTISLAGGAPLSFSVVANTVTRIFLNSSGAGTVTGTTPVYYASNTAVYLDVDGIKSLAAIKITTADPVVVYSHIIKSARSAATLCLPTPVLGNEYIAPSMASATTTQISGNGTIGGVAEIAVVATLPNTVVTITPTAAGRSGAAAGSTFSVTLPNAGDCYQFQSVNLGDLSGTKISSSTASGSSGCKPIAVFSATTWSAFGCGTTSSGGDNLYQQLFPTRSWGKTFVTAPFINRPSEIFRVLVLTDTTVVKIQENGNTFTLGSANYNAAGKYYTYTTANPDPLIITGSGPISVAQYITSESCKAGCSSNSTVTTCYADPEMVLLNPVEQTLQDITFFSAHKDYVPAGQTNVVVHFVNVIVSKNFKASVKIDNAAPKGSFVDIPNSNYSYLQEDLTISSATNPIHRVVADTSFSAIVYGYGNVESYGYNGGTNVKDFTPTPTFQNPYNRIDSSVTCVNTPVKFSVPLTFTPSTIQWDFTAAPNITPSAGIGPLTSFRADSTKSLNGQSVNYYSTGVTYTFTKSNTSAQRDTVKLFTTSATPDGCGSNSQVFTLPIKVNDQPTARFTFNSNGCVTDSVKFFDSSIVNSGILLQWIWDFGNSTSLTQLNNTAIPVKYAAAGSYKVKLRVVSDIGCISDSSIQTVALTDKPIASFTYTTVACAGSDIVFTDASTSTGTITQWIWNLDDGAGAFTNASNASVKTNYAVYGLKNPSLQVVMSNGCKSNAYIPTNPQLKINPLPDIGFVIPQICLSDANAQFNDTSSIAEGSAAAFTYLWNFNAGSPAISPGPTPVSSTLKNPLIIYKKADNYKVSLTVKSAAGCIATKTQDFTVNGSTPKANFSILNTPPYCGIKPIQLKNNSTVDFGNLTKVEIDWDLVKNPSVKDIDQSPAGKTAPYTHSYPSLTAPQAYTIKLLAFSGGSACVDSMAQNITVYPQPKAAFTASATQLCYGNTISFTDNSNGVSSAASSWFWNLGGGTLSTQQNPVKQYNDSGLVNVSMYFYNADGCISDTAIQKLTIYPNPQVVLTHNVRVLEGGTITLIPQFVYGNNLQYLWTPATYLSSDTAANPKSVPQDNITYTLQVTGDGGCSASDTISIIVLKGPEVPNAFSPNGDGINDKWKIKYLEYYPDATVQVYNRYGQLVFSSVGYNNEWDGTYQGRPLPIGTYYYVINPKNGRPTVSGSVTIIK